MKKILSLIIAIILILSTPAGVSAQEITAPEMVESSVRATTLTEKEFREKYGERLSSDGVIRPNILNGGNHGYYYAQQDIYGKRLYECVEYMLVNEIYDYLYRIPEVAYNMEEADAIYDVYYEEANLNKAYYGAVYDYPYYSDNINMATEFSGTLTFGGQMYLRVMMKPIGYCTDSVREQRDEYIDAVATQALKKDTAYKQLRYVHDAIVDNAVYDYNNVNNLNPETEGYFYAHTAYGIAIKGTGVCESYAKLYKEILDNMGYTSVLGISTNHMWNVVKTGSYWYIVDGTFNDTGATNEYFLCPKIDSQHEDNSFLIQPAIADEYCTDGNNVAIVRFSADAAYAGNTTRSFSVSAGSDIVSQKWIDTQTGEILTSGDKYEKNKEYEFTATVKASDGMAYSEDVSVYVSDFNFDECDIEFSTGANDEVIINISGKVKILEEIKTLTYRLLAVIPGKTAPLLTLPADSPVIEVADMWMEEAADGTFTPVTGLGLGNEYAYAYAVKAKEGYALTENSGLEINGVEWDKYSCDLFTDEEGTDYLGFEGYYTVKEHTHTPVPIPAKEPNCTEEGLTEGIMCETCEEILKKQEILPIKHDYTTSSKDGVKTFTCKKCGDTYSRLLNEEEIAFFSSGDVNYDGIINSADLSLLLSLYGTTDSRADITTDGLVNSTDLSVLLSNYGRAL